VAGPGIYDPDLYLDGPPHELFEELRRTNPVVWQDIPGQPGYWAVLRHADVMAVARQPEVFSASLGGVVLEDLEAEQLAMMRNMLLAMDPPRHSEYRRPLAPSFKAKAVASLEARVRSICRRILEEAGERGEVEFVHDVTAMLPSQVVGELMGLPSQDWSYIQRLAEMNTSGQDAELAASEGYSQASVEMAAYAMAFAARRRAEEPRPDLTTLILDAEFAGAKMTDADFASFFVQLVTAGNDTTKTMLSSGLLALLEHPASLAELRHDPGLVPGAVEEVLRWANPLHYFRRTAVGDTELGGVRIAAGDKVAMYYTSANRDEAVFEDPHRFDVHRQPNPHLSFGVGQHFCLGAHLARLEGRVFFEELLATFPRIELAGRPERVRSNLNNALKRLPVRLGR
jgi:cytochrome P450